jgi:sulfide:quinone oxidoreductase
LRISRVIRGWVGAERARPQDRVLTWTPETDADLFGGLLRDLDEGYLKRVAFVVPSGVAWALPAYELALMTAWQVWGMGHGSATAIGR